MIEKFWESIGEALAKEWTARVLAPAFAFWGGGLLAWAWRYGWSGLAAWWTARSGLEQVVLLVAGLLGVALSAVGVEWLQDWALRLVEGYWPGPLRFALARWREHQVRRMEERWQDLAGRCDGHLERLSPREQAEYGRLDALRLRLPFVSAHLMPTLVGNLLRAAEEYPQVRYGLAAHVSWPRLWLLLPGEVRQEIAAARARLNEAVRLLIWGVLLIVWTVWAWWAAPVGVVVACLAYGGIVRAASVYGDLVRAAFDLHRLALYDSLGRPRPEESEEEAGEKLTEYLARGTGGPVRGGSRGPA